MKLTYLIFCLLLSTQSYAFTILLDPGHGGKDTGAMSRVKLKLHNKKEKKHLLLEKDLSLIIAKRLFNILKNKGYQVFLTRSVDRTVSLEQRAELVNKVKADIFISIHLNSSTIKNPRGFETYYLSHHKDKAIQKVEELENKNLKGEAKITNQILVDLIVERVSPRSKKLATLIHNNVFNRLKKKYPIKNRGIKPGLFYVLALTKIPAVLLEIGFLSNPKEAKKMLSSKFQRSYVKAIAEGVDKYFSSKKQNFF